MGIALNLNATQQTFFTAYKIVDKSNESNTLDAAYGNFLKVLKDNNQATDKGLIYLNRYLNTEYFESTEYDETDFNRLNSALASYLTTTDQQVRNLVHKQILLYLTNQTIPNLFIQSLERTNSFFTMGNYTEGGNIPESYVQGAAFSEDIGSVSFVHTLIQD